MTETSYNVKRYNTTKLVLSLIGGIVSFLSTFVLLANGYTLKIEQFAFSCSANSYVALLIFSAIFGAIGVMISLPFSFYTGYIVEHRYNLSNQTARQWAWEILKSLFVSIAILTPLLIVFYFIVVSFESLWWLPVSVTLFIVSIGLSRIAPIMILPLFYKLTPLEDSSLKEKILALTKSTDMMVEGIYSFNLSKTTKKANAAFTGIGKSKRILLSDTLMHNFSEEEIEIVFAHELGHYIHGHIWKGIAASTGSIFLGMYVTSIAYSASLSWFGFTAIVQLSAFPLLVLWLGLYSLIVSPFSNFISRRHEFEADRYAIERTKNRSAFITTMNKLADMNLADRTPHPMIEFLFYSHPSIEKRILAVGNKV